MKYFRMSYKEVVEERSYLNILLLNASIPQYITGKKKNGTSEGDEIGDSENTAEYFKNLMQ